MKGFSQDTHACFMNIGISGTRLRCFKTRLLRIKHYLIQATLEISKMAVSGESPRNICSVQAVNLNAGINEQKLA